MNDHMLTDQQFKTIWDKPIIRIGVITIILGALSAFLPVIYICIKTGQIPTVQEFFSCWGRSASTWGALYVVEPLTYYAVLGLSGTYIAFLTGNLGNMRIPCASAALEATGVQPGTRQGEIVSTLGIAGSAITSIIFTTLAAILGVQIMAILPEPLVVAFNNYTVPAIFGAVLGQYVLKEPIICVFGVAMALFFIYVLTIPSWLAMFASVILSIVFARVLYKHKKSLLKSCKED